MAAAFPEVRPRQKLRVFGGEQRHPKCSAEASGAAGSRSLAQGWGVRTCHPREASLGPLVSPLQLTVCPSSRGLGPSCLLCSSEVPSSSKLVIF